MPNNTKTKKFRGGAYELTPFPTSIQGVGFFYISPSGKLEGIKKKIKVEKKSK